MAGQRRCSRPSSLHRRAVRPRRLTGFRTDDSYWPESLLPELRNETENRSLNKALSPYDQPRILTIAASYTVPGFHINKFLSLAVRDWTLNTLLSYSSGLPILAPYANNQLNQSLLRKVGTAFVNSTPSSSSTGTFADRVPGVPLFTEDLNCHCLDPNKVFVLNPAASTDPTSRTVWHLSPVLQRLSLSAPPDRKRGPRPYLSGSAKDYCQPPPSAR